MKKEDNLVSTGLYTAVFDLIFALIAGFAIMPAVFVGWRLKKAEVIQEIPRPIYYIVKWIVPAVIVAIFVSNLAMK